jgi:hypothetical protein
MIKSKLLVLTVGGLLFLLVLACGSVGIYDPQATQVSMQSTVSALQETIAALETSAAGQAQSQAQATPVVIVVTATPGPTFTLLPTLTLEPSPTVTPPSTVSGSSEREVIVVVVTPTPTSGSQSAPPATGLEAPIITEPREGTIVEEKKEILLRWSWNGALGPDEYFDLKIRPDGQTKSAYVAWEKANAHDWQANLAPGRYFWSVQIIKGYYKNNSGEPEDRVLEAYLGPESEPRLIIVNKKAPTKTPTKSPTKTPVPTSTPASTPTSTPTP